MFSSNLRIDDETGVRLTRDFTGRWQAFEPSDEDLIEIRQEEYSRLSPRRLAKARRHAKAKYARRRGNVAWAGRQRREDKNSQVIY